MHGRAEPSGFRVRCRPVPGVGRVRSAGWFRWPWCSRSPWPCGWRRPTRSSGTSGGVSRSGWTSSPTPTSTGNWHGPSARVGRTSTSSGATSRISRSGRRAIRCCWRSARPLFGDRTLPVRLVQAVLGTLCVYLVYHLARQVVLDGPGLLLGRGVGAMAPVHPFDRRCDRGRQPALRADVFVHPVRGRVRAADARLVARPGGALARATGRAGGLSPIATGRFLLLSLGTGAAAGAAVLVRPSWALFVPAMLAAWVVAGLRIGQGRSAVRGAVLCARASSLVMAPWWVRNARVYGRFVPTALWLGASLYDGLNPRATGASDMLPFLRDPEIWPLDEQDQDAELTRRAIAFARQEPGSVLGLAFLKFGRYWSPWPNAAGFRSWGVAVGQRRSGDTHPRDDCAGPLGTPPRSPRLGSSSPGRSSTSSPCTPCSRARCATASPARCPRWDWRRSDAFPGWRGSVRAGDDTAPRAKPRPHGFPREGGARRCESADAWRRCCSGAWCSACRSSAAGSGSPTLM